MKKIPLTQGKFAIVDDKDYEMLSQHKWYAHKGGRTYYAYGHTRDGTKLHTVIMHRAILRPRQGLQIDHCDGNGLNNQRDNLRPCTQSQNQHNRKAQGGSSKYKGVYLQKPPNKWQSRITVDGKMIYLGLFTDEADAARAYDAKAKAFFGEFACLNFPEQ